MAIINRYNLYDVNLANSGKFREAHDRNPQPAYRELLATEPSAEQAATGVDFAPYALEFAEEGVRIVAVPHGLTTVAANPITPDVVIPIPLYLIDGGEAATFAGDVRTVADSAGLTTTSGWTADETYVYLAVYGGVGDVVRFYVYIEWTHSIIKNEVVTADYNALAFYKALGQE